MNWLKKFWNEHGTRLFYMFLANSFAYFFYHTEDEKLIGTAYAIFTGSAIIFMNKARGNGTTSSNGESK